MRIEVIQVASNEAIAQLKKYREQFRTTGKYPFLIRDAEALELLEENMEDGHFDPAKDLESAKAFDIQAWIDEEKQEYEEFDIPDEALLGTWPSENPPLSEAFNCYYLERNQPKEISIGFTEVEAAWQLPAMISYGGWNDCPHPDVQAAFHRHWSEKYGAEITSMSGDIVECYVKHPPTTREAALELAWEQYWYCKDIVDQGCETISNLAATLLNSPYWFFWWD